MNKCPTCDRPMQNKQGLSRDQALFMGKLRALFDELGYSPSMREMAEHFNLSLTAIWNRLAVLERKGHIHHTKHQQNSVTFID